jgi:hypothetical protein
VEGTLVGLGPDGAVIQPAGGQAPLTLPLDGLVWLRLPARPRPATRTRRYRVTLAGGSVLVALLAGAREDVLTFSNPAWGSLDVLLDQVRRIQALEPGTDPGCVGPRQTKPLTEDVAESTNKDEYHGSVLSANAEHVVIESEHGRDRRLPWAELSLLRLLPAGDAPKPAEGLQAEVALQDGSLLRTAQLPTWKDGAFHLALRSLPKKALVVKAGDVRAVRFSGGRFVYACHVPFDSRRVPYYEDDPKDLVQPVIANFFDARVDRRPSGCPLRMAGATYRHGFGVRSHAILTLHLDGAYAKFRSVFGIDESGVNAQGERGFVDARVLADDKVLWEAKGVRGGEKPRTVGPLDVRGVKTLVLEVGYGGHEPGQPWGFRLPTLDRADWADPILERAASR